MARTATIARKTNETDITLSLNLDGTGQSTIATGVGFFDHMLTHLAKHSMMDLSVTAKGDLGAGEQGGDFPVWVGGDSDGGHAGACGAGPFGAAGVCF
jgi:hypothetical protein